MTHKSYSSQIDLLEQGLHGRELCAYMYPLFLSSPERTTSLISQIIFSYVTAR